MSLLFSWVKTKRGRSVKYLKMKSIFISSSLPLQTQNPGLPPETDFSRPPPHRPSFNRSHGADVSNDGPYCRYFKDRFCTRILILSFIWNVIVSLSPPSECHPMPPLPPKRSDDLRFWSEVHQQSRWGRHC